MKLDKVKSSSIAAIGHDGKALHVQFANGNTYRYDGVSEKEFDTLNGADSIGQHFAAHIRGKHDGVKVG